MPSRLRPSLVVAAAAVAQVATIPVAAAWRYPFASQVAQADYKKVVKRVAGMVDSESAWSKVARRGLSLINVMWEDTGRWEGSSVGPNISDVTIEVEASKGHHYLMPVVRYDNFTDKTADVKLDKIFVPVGNHDGQPTDTITLQQLLAEPTAYLSLPNNGTIKKGTLLAKRDTHALVSAQHAFLPVPDEGQAKFWPVIFNYQSTKHNPAVLAILVTRQGTSMTIIDNDRDTVSGAGSWGQRLYFNDAGQKAPLIAERMTDVQEHGVTANGEAAASLGEDANLLMLIQVPLKFKAPKYDAPMEMMPMKMASPSSAASLGAGDSVTEEGGGGGGGGGDYRGRESSDVDTAVIGHGDTEGAYTELDGLTIERDPRFPVRVTIQFYQATSNGVLASADVDKMAKQIKAVYKQGDYVGSLVVPDPGDRLRPTNWTGVTTQPDGWAAFPGLTERYIRYGALWYPESAVTGVTRPTAGIATN